MRTSISISLPEKLNEELNQAIERSHFTRSEIVKNAIEEYLFKWRFQRARKKLVLKARGKGIFTDEDVMKHLS